MCKNISRPYITKKEFYLGILTTPIHLFFFGISLIVIDIIARVVWRIYGNKKVSVIFRWKAYITLFLLKYTSGGKFYFRNTDVIKKLPKDRPVILVSNHQSLYDTAIHLIFLKDHDIVFIAKKELSKWIPTVAVCMRAQDTALIDRDNPKQSIQAIKELGKRMQEEKFAVGIYAEGTRAKDGKLKEFKDAGIKTLLKQAKDAVILPVAVDGSWKTFAYSYFPIPFGVKLFVEYLEPIEPKDYDISNITSVLHAKIENKIKEFRGEL
ncbi:MAG: lysophospholipid acyltransferase family protein [Bdellovibrionota bacterium]